MQTHKHLIDLNDFPVNEWQEIIDLALKIEQRPADYFGAMSGRILATLFYEPSTRTQMSFQTAMLRLGGQIIGFDNPQTSSVAKGENLKDTIRIVSGYADIVAMRHPLEGSAKAAAYFSSSPIINAGDGGHLHPTQTLTDLVTLARETGQLSGLTIGICGDLKYGRTVHSLIKALCRFGNSFVLISTQELAVPYYLKDCMDASGCSYTEVNSLQEAMPMLDVLYMTRIQRERFASEAEYARQKNVYVLDKPKLAEAKKALRILHPLPRVDEITAEVDSDPRAVYFKQAQYGVYARMALILHMLQSQNSISLFSSSESRISKCTNPRCITNTEGDLPKHFHKSGDLLVCEYCDERILV